MMREGMRKVIISHKEMITNHHIREIIKEDRNSNQLSHHGEMILKLSRKRRKIVNLFKHQLNKRIKLSSKMNQQRRKELKIKRI